MLTRTHDEELCLSINEQTESQGRWSSNCVGASFMKPRFWIFAVLLLIGAVLAGYSSGRYEGVRRTRIETQQFLREFASATDLQTYLQQRGQKEWISKLAVYGIGGPTSYFHSKRPSAYAILAGIVCVTVGLVGLLPFSQSRQKIT